MQLSKNYRKKLADELAYCAEKILKERDLRTKLFFYRNAAESVDNIVDMEYDSQLVLIEMVLEVTGSTLTARVENTLAEKGNSMGLSDGLFDKLSACLKELSTQIIEEQETYKTVEKISELAFF